MLYQEDHALDNASSLQGQTSSSGDAPDEPISNAPPAYTQEDPLQGTSRSNSSIAGEISNQSTKQWDPDSGFSRDRSFKPLEGSSKPSRKVSILFMGDTGVGKSSIISNLTSSAVKVGHSLIPNTTESQAWEYTHDDLAISLIDTPGFNDTTRSEMQILGSIATYIMDRNLPPIIGVVYMHRITDRRVTGSSRLNLDMLRAMCGPEYSPSLVLVTTMWDKISEEDLGGMRSREKELNNSSIFWGDLITDGATYSEYKGTRESAQEIIELVLSNDTCPTLRIMLEMQGGVALEDTAAGRVLTAELRRREEKLLQEQLEEDKLEERRLRAKKAELEEETRQLREIQAREEEQHYRHRRRSVRRSRTFDESPPRRARPGTGFRLSLTGYFSRT